MVLLSSLRDYRGVVLGFLLGYSISVGGALRCGRSGWPGCSPASSSGRSCCCSRWSALVVAPLPERALVSFEFLDRRRAYFTLAATGFLYNLGIWIDKLLFWFTPSTSEPVLGPLRASIIYDMPIFLAYLSIVPGMAVFLVRVETAFAEQYDGFFARGPRAARRWPTSAADAIG